MTIQAVELDLYGILQVDPRAHPSVIQAAYRALARLLHPDQTRSDATEPAMALVNRAYGVLRDPSQRDAYDQARRQPARPPTRPPARPDAGHAAFPPPGEDAKGTTVTFGRYRGWTLEQLARHDPGYLEWLRRHSSGMVHRRRIDEILAATRAASARRIRAQRR